MYPVQPDAITSFRGEYRFLSNFYPVEVKVQGIYYPTAEHAYQAQKTLDLETRRKMADLPGPIEAKKFGQMVELREDWEEVKRRLMIAVVAAKFSEAELSDLLLSTENRQLVEGNTWGDRYWGCVRRKGVWVGKNYLGRTLMRVRAMIRKEFEIGRFG